MAHIYALEIGGSNLPQLEAFFRPIQQENGGTVIGTVVYPNAVSIQIQTPREVDQDALIKEAYNRGLNLGITEVK